ncbi:hypothetical protein O181_028090 [Austropuccinia psidii MF-1]|uniref:Uncharacterized protein n=1 Tax=Austropuccinia psidii MF-1 TaxID=1389203 RepID=A0A9Q3CSM0_9BASI|nr:hypothetical protein [Austropuccinia psidii MF-1]
MEPDFKEGDQVLVSTLNFNKLKGPKKMRDSFEFSKKHPAFPVSFVKPNFQTDENKLPSRKKNLIPPEIEDSPGPVRKIIKARNMRLNSKDQRQYSVRYRNQTADKNKWLAEDAIPDGNLHLRGVRASRRTEKFHQ